MNALVMVSLGLQVLAQFGTMIDEGFAYMMFLYDFFGPCFEAIGLAFGCVSEDVAEDGVDALAGDGEVGEGEGATVATDGAGLTRKMSTTTGAVVSAGFLGGCAAMCLGKSSKKKKDDEGPLQTLCLKDLRPEHAPGFIAHR